MNDKQGWNFPADLLEAAWGIIANAGEGDWTRESPQWQEAAARWRDAYHATLPGAAERSVGTIEEAVAASKADPGVRVEVRP